MVDPARFAISVAYSNALSELGEKSVGTSIVFMLRHFNITKEVVIEL
jgi:hypothetical protein